MSFFMNLEVTTWRDCVEIQYVLRGQGDSLCPIGTELSCRELACLYQTRLIDVATKAVYSLWTRSITPVASAGLLSNVVSEVWTRRVTESPNVGLAESPTTAVLPVAEVKRQRQFDIE